MSATRISDEAFERHRDALLESAQSLDRLASSFVATIEQVATAWQGEGARRWVEFAQRAGESQRQMHRALAQVQTKLEAVAAASTAGQAAQVEAVTSRMAAADWADAEGNFIGGTSPTATSAATTAAGLTVTPPSMNRATTRFEVGPMRAVVLHGAASPRTHGFAMNVPPGGSVKVQPDKSAVVLDRAGRVVEKTLPPWAVDARGRHQRTWYTVDGHTLVQHVAPSKDAVYPIVADPMKAESDFADIKDRVTSNRAGPGLEDDRNAAERRRNMRKGGLHVVPDAQGHGAEVTDPTTGQTGTSPLPQALHSPAPQSNPAPPATGSPSGQAPIDQRANSQGGGPEGQQAPPKVGDRFIDDKGHVWQWTGKDPKYGRKGAGWSSTIDGKEVIITPHDNGTYDVYSRAPGKAVWQVDEYGDEDNHVRSYQYPDPGHVEFMPLPLYEVVPGIGQLPRVGKWGWRGGKALFGTRNRNKPDTPAGPANPMRNQDLRKLRELRGDLAHDAPGASWGGRGLGKLGGVPRRLKRGGSPTVPRAGGVTPKTVPPGTKTLPITPGGKPSQALRDRALAKIPKRLKGWGGRLFDDLHNPHLSPGKRAWARGNLFNLQNRHRYKANEVYVDVLAADRKTVLRRVRIDSYNPGRDIVSRKYTQMADITPATAKSYLRELVDKYPPRNPRYRIADVPTARKNPDLRSERGEMLRGRQILEVPVQHRPIPKSVLDYARQRDIQIRDVTGKVYT